MKTFSSSFLLAMVLLAIVVSGCASMNSSKEQLQNVRNDEGVIFGSFVINVEQGGDDGSSLAFWKGQKAGNATYAVIFTKRGLNPIKQRYMIRATPEKEDVFIKKLPAGWYEIEKISKEGFSNLELSLHNVNFQVVPNQNTYIGKLTVQFPKRIMVGTPVFVKVGDSQQETTESLKIEHEKSLSNVVKQLVVVQ
jgi:hypothetical protein